MSRERFQSGLEELKQKLMLMGSVAEKAVEESMNAHQARDSKACYRVFEIERRVNAMEREIDELAIDLLAMQQPMAVDLRFITACMKINADLERIGDQAVNIAERVLSLLTLPATQFSVDLPRMAGAVAAMAGRALEAFVEGRADLADAVLKMDDAVDKLNADIFVAMAKSMKSNAEISQQALDTLLIARNLERVADHATNIAEDVIYWVRGADVRHRFALLQPADVAALGKHFNAQEKK
jgi:phosphate transport system protein